MKKGILWIFGDSYGTIHRPSDQIKDWHWMWQLTDLLGHENFYNICKDGVANEWSYQQLILHADQIDSQNDTIIFISTQLNRQWFFPGNDGIGNLNMPTYNSYVTKEEFEAVSLYRKYLTNNPQDTIRYQWLLYAINFLAIKHNLNLLVVPGFESENFFINNKIKTIGSLFDVCMHEIKGKNFDSWGKWIGAYNGVDPREGHISECNHPILAKKLYNSIRHNADLDLTTEFYEEIL